MFRATVNLFASVTLAFILLAVPKIDGARSDDHVVDTTQHFGYLELLGVGGLGGARPRP